jgi:hypothetical protein
MGPASSPAILPNAKSPDSQGLDQLANVEVRELPLPFIPFGAKCTRSEQPSPLPFTLLPNSLVGNLDISDLPTNIAEPKADQNSPRPPSTQPPSTGKTVVVQLLARKKPDSA